MSTGTSSAGGEQLGDEQQLHKLGYAQELFRSMGGFENFAISFTIISILAGCLTSYFIAFNNGGPVAITWGWLLVGGFCIIVSLAMGEIASTYPTAGGLYFWASKLGSPAWGWFTGWFNLLGQIAVTAAIGYGCAIFTTSLLNLLFDYPNTTRWVMFTYTVIMVGAGLINLFAVPITAMLNNISAWWHMIGVLLIVAILIVVPDHHQSVGYVFGKTINNSGFSGSGWGSLTFWFVFGIGLLMAQYTITGYDASAHMSEETRQASRGAAIGMVMSVVVSVIFGFVLLVAVTFAVPDTQGTLGAGANAVTYIWETAMSRRWAEFLLFIAVVAQIFCTIASVTSASRMMFAFSRDGAVPGYRLWRKVSHRFRVPVNAVWAIVVLSWALMLPTLSNAAVGYLVGHLDRGDRPLHRLRAADHPALARRRELRARRLASRQSLQVDRPARDRLDRPDLHPLPDADGADRHPVEDGLRLERRQLRAAHGRRCVRALRRLVPALGPQVVQGPGAAGHR